MGDGEFETERLYIRDWRPRDLEDFISLRTNPQVMAHFPGTDSLEKIREIFPEICQKSAERGYGFRPLFEKASERFVGFCGVTDVNFEAPFTPAKEVGWSLLPEFWGKGYATEAASGWLDYAFGSLPVSVILAFAVTQNVKSHAVMERLGMKRDKTRDFIHPRVPDDYQHLKLHIVYSITSSQWRAEKKGRQIASS